MATEKEHQQPTYSMSGVGRKGLAIPLTLLLLGDILEFTAVMVEFYSFLLLHVFGGKSFMMIKMY